MPNFFCGKCINVCVIQRKESCQRSAEKKLHQLICLLNFIVKKKKEMFKKKRDVFSEGKSNIFTPIALQL